MSTNTPRPSKADRRDQARAEALRLREESKRKEKRNRGIAIAALAAAVVVLVVVGVWIVGSAPKPIAYQGEEPLDVTAVTKPSTANDSGGIPVGTDLAAGSTARDGADAVVEVVFDYQCPHCANFEGVNGPDIQTLLEMGNVEFVFRPVAFMDYASGGKEFSTRAANAAATVADLSPEHYLDFHNALLANQPNRNGLSDDEIGQIALDAGVPQATVDEFTTLAPGTDERVYSRWIAAATQHTTEYLGGNLSTPAVLINGQLFPGPDQESGIIYQPGGLAAGVMTAIAGADSEDAGDAAAAGGDEQDAEPADETE